MGLTEETNYSQDTMTSILYVNHAGPKDVGKYRLLHIPSMYKTLNSYLFSCSIISNDILDIDEPVSEASVYVWVRSSQLTSLDPDSLLLVTSVRDSEVLIPCVATMPGVRVSLVTPGGSAVSRDLVTHRPRQAQHCDNSASAGYYRGHTRVKLVLPTFIFWQSLSQFWTQGFIVNSGAVLPRSNLQCQFSDNQRSETVKVQMISSNSWSQDDSGARVEVSLTLVHTDADLELDSIQLVCKARSIF